MIRLNRETQWAICRAWLDTGRVPTFADVEEATVRHVLALAGAPNPHRVNAYLHRVEQETRA